MTQAEARSRAGSGLSPTGGLCRGLTEDQCKTVLAAARLHEYKRRQIILQTGETATRLYLLRRGHVHFYGLAADGRKILLRRLASGDVFGIGSLIGEPECYIGTAEAMDCCDVLSWDRTCIRRFSARYPLITENALRIVFHYIGLFARRHMALVTDNAADRLAHVLSRLASRTGVLLSDGVEINVKNEDLASLADINPFTASRLLKEWERRGVLRKKRGKVLIHCPEKLLAA